MVDPNRAELGHITDLSGCVVRCPLLHLINQRMTQRVHAECFPQVQFPVLSSRGVETSSRGGGVGDLPQQTAAVQPGRRSQQD